MSFAPRVIRLLVAMGLGSAGASGTSAFAATITVDEDGGCTLGQAILSANADAAVATCTAGSGADTILIPAGTITFTDWWDTDFEPSSALPHVTSDIGFVGAGAGLTVLERDPSAPEFRLVQVSATVHTTFEGITFAGFKAQLPPASSTWGGVIASYGYGPGQGSLTITDCAFLDNEADGGGAISWGPWVGSLTVRGSRFEGNVGREGASAISAQYLDGDITITGSIFDGNTGASGAVALGGAGVGHVLVDQSVFSGNTCTTGAALTGLGVAGANGTITVKRTDFIGGSDGVALSLGDSAGALVEDCNFQDNTATNRAAALSAVLSTPLTIRGSTFSGNDGFYQGGALFVGAVEVDEEVLIEDCVFADNTSTQGGGAFITGAGLTRIDDCTFEHNRATTIPGYTSGQGGALFIGGPTEITSSVFSGNDDPVYTAGITATLPNAAESGIAGELTVSLATRGAAIYSGGTPYTVNFSCFVGNAAHAVFGGPSDARFNWWGAADGPGGEGSGSGDTVAGEVTTSSYYFVPPTGCGLLVPDLDPVPINATVPQGAGYATPGDDYVALSPPFSVDPVAGRLVLSIDPVNDVLVEGPEVVHVALVEGDGYLGAGNAVEVVIADDGTGFPSCDDGVACTTDQCVLGDCQHTLVHSACDDGVACTADTCTLTGCAHAPQHAQCADTNPCTADTCTASGCTNAMQNSLCDDGKPCTADTCTVAGCVHSPQDSLCDDGVSCTSDACISGTCLYTPVNTACNDNVACTVDACGPTGCTHTPQDSLCADASACTVDTCTFTGCSNVADDSLCDDGKACTVDSCAGASGCVFAPQNSLCDDDNPCTTDMCISGTCIFTNNSAACDDGDPCTTGTACHNGACGGGSMLPSCESHAVDLGPPFGVVNLGLPTGGVCFSGQKLVSNCAPFASCTVKAEECAYATDRLVELTIEVGLGLWGKVPFRGLWKEGGFCLDAPLPSLGAPPVTTTDGTLMACWDGAGKGSLFARATTASVSSLSGLSGQEVSGSLAARDGALPRGWRSAPRPR